MRQSYTILFLILFIFILFLPALGCKSEDRKNTQIKIEKILAMGEDNPEQVLLFLDSMHVSKKLDEKNFMLYQIALIKAKRNAGINIDNDGIEKIGEAAEYFNKTEDAKYAALANYYAGVVNGKIDEKVAFTYFLQALPYAELENDSLLIGKSLYNVGSIYYDQQVYDSATVYIEKSIPFLRQSPQAQVQAYRFLGSNYYRTKRYDDALQSLYKGLPLLKYPENKKYAYSFYGTYAVIYKDIKQYDKAAEYFRKNLREENTSTERLRAALNMTEVYTLANNSDSATYYKDLVEPWLAKYQLRNKDDEYLALFGYKVLLNYYIAQKDDKDQVLKYMHLHSQKRADLDNANITQELYEANQKVNIQRIYAANREYNIKVLMYVILSILVLFCFILLIIRVRFKRREAAAINQELQEIDKLRDELRKLRDSEDQER